MSSVEAGSQQGYITGEGVHGATSIGRINPHGGLNINQCQPDAAEEPTPPHADLVEDWPLGIATYGLVYLTTLLLPPPLTSLTPRCQRRRRGGCRRWRLLVTNHPPPSSLAAPPPRSLLSQSRVSHKPLFSTVLSLCRVWMCVCLCVWVLSLIHI